MPSVDRATRSDVEGKYFDNRPGQEPPFGMEWIQAPADWTVQTKRGGTSGDLPAGGEFAGAPKKDAYMTDPKGKGEFGGAPKGDQYVVDTTGQGEFTSTILTDAERAELRRRADVKRREAAASVFYENEPTDASPPE